MRHSPSAAAASCGIRTWATESVEEWIYAGCRPTGFELSVSKDNPWMLKVDFDAQSEARGGSAVAQTYHSVTQQFFNWDGY